MRCFSPSADDVQAYVLLSRCSTLLCSTEMISQVRCPPYMPWFQLALDDRRKRGGRVRLEPNQPDLRERYLKLTMPNSVQLRWTGILNFPIYQIQAKHILRLLRHLLSKSIYSRLILLQGALLFHQNRNRVEPYL